MIDDKKFKSAWEKVHKEFHSKRCGDFVFYEIPFKPERNETIPGASINAYIKLKEAEFFISEKLKLDLENYCDSGDKDFDEILNFSEFDEDGYFLDCCLIKKHDGLLEELKEKIKKHDDRLLGIMKNELIKVKPESPYWISMKVAYPVLKGKFNKEQLETYEAYEIRYGEEKLKDNATPEVKKAVEMESQNKEENKEKEAYESLLGIIQNMKKEMKEINEKGGFDKKKFVKNSMNKHKTVLEILPSFEIKDERSAPYKNIAERLNLKNGEDKEPNKIALFLLAEDRDVSISTIKRKIYPEKQNKQSPLT